MKVRIHRGAHEIGGSCVELESQGQRIVLDLGRPLSAQPGDVVPLPPVPGLDGQDKSLLGIVLSHVHQDHCGLMPQVAATVPCFVGERAAAILREAAFFTGSKVVLTPAGYLRHRQPFQLGPFSITPLLNDHSAFDAYSLLVEADGQRLFYTGDLRSHGRKAGLFEALLRDPPRPIDVLLMEGTHVSADSDGTERGCSEDDVERECLSAMRASRGLALAIYSAQNIDRLVTLYRATVQANREFVMDLYTASVAQATGAASIPQAHWPKVRVYVPQAQRIAVKRAGEFDRVRALGQSRIYAPELRARRAELTMTFRLSMGRELARDGCLDGATAIWSLWPGYLESPSGHALLELLDQHGVPLRVGHSSGHAFISDLQRLVRALTPRQVVPIHSAATDRFATFFDRVCRQVDGAWWSVQAPTTCHNSGGIHACSL